MSCAISRRSLILAELSYWRTFLAFWTGRQASTQKPAKTSDQIWNTAITWPAGQDCACFPLFWTHDASVSQFHASEFGCSACHWTCGTPQWAKLRWSQHRTGLQFELQWHAQTPPLDTPEPELFGFQSLAELLRAPSKLGAFIWAFGLFHAWSTSRMQRQR